MGISLREYAKRRGCHHSSVQAAVDSGRIHKLADGTIDPVQADREWRENTGRNSGDKYREALTRKELATAGLKQIDLQERMGRIVEMQIVQTEWFAVQRDLMEKFMSLGREVMPRLLEDGGFDLAKGIKIIDEAVVAAIKDYENGWESRILKIAAGEIHAQDGAGGNSS